MKNIHSWHFVAPLSDRFFASRPASLLVLILALLLIGCREAPEQIAARQGATDLVTALLQQDGQTLDTIFCAEFPDESGGDALLSLWAIGLAAWQADIEIATLNPQFTYEVVAFEPTAAEIVVIGDIDVKQALRDNRIIMGVPDEESLHIDTTWHFVLEEDGWKMCGSG